MLYQQNGGAEDRCKSPEMHSHSLGTEDFCAYSLLPSAVGKDDPEASCSPYQHKTVRIRNNLWFPSISNTCVFLNPKTTQEQISVKSHESQNLLLSCFWRHTCQSTDFGLSYQPNLSITVSYLQSHWDLNNQLMGLQAIFHNPDKEVLKGISEEKSNYIHSTKLSATGTFWERSNLISNMSAPILASQWSLAHWVKHTWLLNMTGKQLSRISQLFSKCNFMSYISYIFEA